MSPKIFINNEFVNKEDAKVSVFDHGLLYGDGIFEGIRSYNRRVLFLDEHIIRLYQGAAAIRLEIPLTEEAFKDRVIETLKINKLDNAYIRAVVTRGVGDLGLDPRKCPTASFFIIADKIKLYPEHFYKVGMDIITSKVRRNHPLSLDPRIKSLNYLNNILAKVNAIDAGTEEALMLTVDGYVAECTGDNIFVVKDGKLHTPASELGALEGITQDAVVDLAARRGIATEYVTMRPEEFFKADECFLTGTAAEIIPVISIDKKKMGNGKPGEITKKLMDDYKNLTNERGVAY